LFATFNATVQLLLVILIIFICVLIIAFDLFCFIFNYSFKNINEKKKSIKVEDTCTKYVEDALAKVGVFWDFGGPEINIGSLDSNFLLTSSFFANFKEPILYFGPLDLFHTFYFIHIEQLFSHMFCVLRDKEQSNEVF
jgi:hypothetical protein